MRPKRKWLIEVLVFLTAMTAMAAGHLPAADASTVTDQVQEGKGCEAIAAPFDGPLKYPFTKSGVQKGVPWRPGSQDYPFFGAPRDGNGRRHEGIDLYPVTGAGTPIKAIRDGTVLKAAPYYRRRNGEITFALLVDHRDYVACYAELLKPTLLAGAEVKKGQAIGFLSGTKQLHFTLYAPGTTDWVKWYGERPPHLIDPTDLMTRVFQP